MIITRKMMVAVFPMILLAGLFSGIRAQTLELKLEGRQVYADLPFVLALTAKGFDEQPVPEAPELRIAGSEVTFLGISPNISSGIQIINGRRTEWRQVQFTYRYRVQAPAEGTFIVPALTVTQGSKTASTMPASFQVKPITQTRDMKIRLELPDRPVWVGETFDVAMEWLLRRDVGDHSFQVPLFDLDHVHVQPAPIASQRTLTIPAGALNINIPYTQDSVISEGIRYTRIRFHALVTVNRPGPIELDPVKVAARLETGTGRDGFGFRVPRYQLFRAEGKTQRLSVRPLPLEGRPDSFENAIGTSFSISVRADRTVVQVGDPVELDVLIRGDGILQGLSLPPLSGGHGLAADLFSVPDQISVGEIDPEGKGKSFLVTVRVRSAEAREIPALQFSYFDPVAGEYRTVKSQPIALSVAGSAIVDAADVEAAPAPAGIGETPGVGPAAAVTTGFATLIGADLSLSDDRSTLRRTWSTVAVTPLLTALYVFPVFVLGFQVWRTRTRGRRGRANQMQSALRELEAILDAGAPARESVPRILKALGILARLTGQEKAMLSPALEKMETRAFDPQAGNQSLSPEVAGSVRELARGWVAAERARARIREAILLFGLLLAGSAAGVSPVRAADDGSSLVKAREIYRAALEEPDRIRRTRLFAEAEQRFAQLASSHDASPDLLTDWGNAALGAQEIGRATLAYRRALHLDPDHHRARKNLAWLRDRAPAWVPRPPERGAIDSLFFWHHTLSVSQRFLLGAAAFAAGLLLLAPWSDRRAKLLRRLAVPALVIWFATTLSAFLAPDPSRNGVVLSDGTVLRSADSLGASPALANPLPAGTELRVLENRGNWIRIALADGTRGWIHSGTFQSIKP